MAAEILGNDLTVQRNLTVAFGRKKKKVKSLQEARDVFDKFIRDEAEYGRGGMSSTPACTIFEGDVAVASVSYNRRVWEGLYWA